MADLGIAMHGPSSLVQCHSHMWCHLSFSYCGHRPLTVVTVRESRSVVTLQENNGALADQGSFSGS